jgi:hypothetical protein
LVVSCRLLPAVACSTKLRDKLEANTKRFRTQMEAAGFDLGVSLHLPLSRAAGMV